MQNLLRYAGQTNTQNRLVILYNLVQINQHTIYFVNESINSTFLPVIIFNCICIQTAWCPINRWCCFFITSYAQDSALTDSFSLQTD